MKCGLWTKGKIILINYKIMNRYFVKRKHKEPVEVAIMWDRTTEKYCFVNLTYSHVCTCRFDTQWDALEDMRNNDEVAEFYRLDLENTRH